MTFDPRALLASLTTEQVAELAAVLLASDPLLNAYQVAEYCNVAPDMVYYWQKTNTGPACMNMPVGPRGDEGKPRTRLRWRQSVVTAWALVRQIPTKGIPYLPAAEQHVVRYALGLESSLPTIHRKNVGIGEAAKALNMPERRLRRMQAAGRLVDVSQSGPGAHRRYDLSVPLTIMPPNKAYRGNTAEAAKKIGISVATLLRHVRDGRIPFQSRTQGGYYVFDLESLPSRKTVAQWLTGNTAEVAKMLKVSHGAVTHWARVGRLKPKETTSGGFYIFDLESLPSQETLREWRCKNRMNNPGLFKRREPKE